MKSAATTKVPMRSWQVLFKGNLLVMPEKTPYEWIFPAIVTNIVQSPKTLLKNGKTIMQTKTHLNVNRIRIQQYHEHQACNAALNQNRSQII